MAEAVAGDHFLAWASRVNIGFDPRYPGTECISMLLPGASSRTWDVPVEPYPIPYFVEVVLDGLDRWDAGYLWPRIGHWPTAEDPGLSNERVRDVVWRILGMPAGWAGAARLGCDERIVVVAALFASLALGGDATSDLYFVPDHGRQIVWAGHHDVIDVACADESRMLEFVRHMAQAGFEPAAPMQQEPDETDAAADGGNS